MPDLEFWSSDHRFGLQIKEMETQKILRACLKSAPNETGGILVGFYTESHDCAIVQDVSEAPADSRSGPMWFVRGIQGLQAWLSQLWHRNRHFYLGEWHFHPYGLPNPSRDDITQLMDISNAKAWQCPEPVLLIIGGNPSGKWRPKAFVFPKDRTPLELISAQGES